MKGAAAKLNSSTVGWTVSIVVRYDDYARDYW
jgi:hypothetical protein